MRENAPTPATPQNTSTKDGEDSTMAKTKTELYDELVDIETSLENHPLTSGKIAEANIIIEQMKEQGATPEEINEALTRQGLPSLVEIGKSTLLQSFSLWKLNHRKLKVEAAIEKINRKEARQRSRRPRARGGGGIETPPRGEGPAPGGGYFFFKGISVA